MKMKEIRPRGARIPGPSPTITSHPTPPPPPAADLPILCGITPEFNYSVFMNILGKPHMGLTTRLRKRDYAIGLFDSVHATINKPEQPTGLLLWQK